MRGIEVILIPQPVDSFDLLEPFELETGVLFHGFSHSHR